MSEQVSTFFWDEAPQHGLEMREGQQDMSFEIVDALINDQHFAIEAGVGIGKSFGYLVPVLLYSKRMNKPVIIATSTIALQEQLWRDVHAVMPLLGLNRDVILAKGQTHYLCNKRADEYMCDPKADPPDALKEGIQQGYEERKDFPEVLPQGVWDKVNVQRFSMKNCGSCEKKCKYYKVRAALKFTDGVVLCNQDFLTQHVMKLRRGQDGLINAAADLLVVDEAHNLDDKVRSATTERFGQGMLFGMIKSAFYELRSSDQSSVSREKREAESSIIAFYNCLKTQVQKQINEADQDMRYADRFFFDQNGSAVELLTEMNAAIHKNHTDIGFLFGLGSRNVGFCILVRLRCNGGCAVAFAHVGLADRAVGVDLTDSAFLLAVTGSQSSRSIFVQQRKQIAFIDHVQEVRLILFLILVDGRIVVDDNEEGVAVLRLDSDELLVGCLVIEQVTGVGVALIVNRLTLRLFRRWSDCGLLFGLSCLRDGKVLIGVIGIGKRRDREAGQNHDADRKDGQKTKLLTHCRLPPYFQRS